jgi:hypothetical protein
VGFTTGSRGKVPGKTCEKRIRKKNNNNNNKNNNTVPASKHHTMKGCVGMEVKFHSILTSAIC